MTTPLPNRARLRRWRFATDTRLWNGMCLWRRTGLRGF